MTVSCGFTDITAQEILNRVSEAEIIYFYLRVLKIPCVICSPLRQDIHPSFSIYVKDNGRIYFKDFATNDHGDVFDLLMKMWSCTFTEAINTLIKDLPKIQVSTHSLYHYPLSSSQLSSCRANTTMANRVSLRCRIRNWREHDINYWESYGISLYWLQYAEVYPISHIFYSYRDTNKEIIISADKYAYCFTEHKDDNTTIKIYQPYNTAGYKWRTTHDGSVIGLWTKIPQCGEEVCICSSVKDALCLWANIGIPSLCLQGEGYKMSKTAVEELRCRFKKVYICFDNDSAGIEDAKSLARDTEFINVVLPQFEGGKDISDLYKVNGLQSFITVMSTLFHSVIPTQQESNLLY